jgi:ParB family transcriptional regulator, chromosome partitioning protein
MLDIRDDTMTDKQKITYLDPRVLRVPKVRITTVWDEDELTALKADVAEQGIETPLLVGNDGTVMWVIDGKHRLDEALLNGFEKIPCIVREMNATKMLFRNLASNRLRGKAPVSQEIQVIQELYTTHGVTIDEICKETGFSRDRVESLVIISQANPEILHALDSGKIGFGHAVQLTRLPDQPSQGRTLSLAIQYSMTVSTLRATVTDVIAIMKSQAEGQRDIQQPTRPSIPTIPCHMCGAERMPHELRSVILCPACSGIVLQARDEVKAALAQPEKEPVKSEAGD